MLRFAQHDIKNENGIALERFRFDFRTIKLGSVYTSYVVNYIKYKKYLYN